MKKVNIISSTSEIRYDAMVDSDIIKEIKEVRTLTLELLDTIERFKCHNIIVNFDIDYSKFSKRIFTKPIKE